MNDWGQASVNEIGWGQAVRFGMEIGWGSICLISPFGDTNIRG